MKKILYLFSDTGGGHRAGAKSLINSVKKIGKEEYSQEMIDFFAEGSDFLNFFAKLYGPLIKFSPKTWGFLYRMLDNQKVMWFFEKFTGLFIINSLVKIIKEKNPDVLVSVHPLVNHFTISAMKKIGKKIPFIVVVMDPVTFHRTWITPEADRYVVATKEAKDLALKYGAKEEKIHIIGLPIDPKFAEGPMDKRLSRKEDGLDENKTTILVMGGGEGGGGIFEIVKEIADSPLNLQTIVISGRNKALQNKLEEYSKKCRTKIKVHGFTDQVYKIMSQSDIIVTKAGPGSIAEALAMNLPIIINSWLPGQEEGNVDFVLKKNLGRVVQDPKKIVKTIEEMLNPAECDKIRKNIEKERKPHAALDIAADIISLI